ncbi:DUF4124 domain-containing protein [Bacterioplanoides sp.]|uniref:DUF4124 domain-containing protein n=1 Tax=Bacterioplanoides sp. TaxID=2066072 RepID=UPI003B5BE260
MKFKIGMMLVVLGAAMAAPYFIQGRGGDLLKNFDAEQSLDILSTEKTRQQYQKWQDEKGVWHFGDSVPEGVATEVVNVDTAANVIRSIKLAKNEEEEQDGKGKSGGPSLPFPGTVSPDKVGEMMDDAKNVQQLLDDRAAQLKKLP